MFYTITFLKYLAKLGENTWDDAFFNKVAGQDLRSRFAQQIDKAILFFYIARIISSISKIFIKVL